jgi:hypothetical protein
MGNTTAHLYRELVPTQSIFSLVDQFEIPVSLKVVPAARVITTRLPQTAAPAFKSSMAL